MWTLTNPWPPIVLRGTPLAFDRSDRLNGLWPLNLISLFKMGNGSQGPQRPIGCRHLVAFLADLPYVPRGQTRTHPQIPGHHAIRLLHLARFGIFTNLICSVIGASGSRKAVNGIVWRPQDDSPIESSRTPKEPGALASPQKAKWRYYWGCGCHLCVAQNDK